MHGKAPYNAEPPLDRLRAAFLTDQADFYVRSHGDIPDLDADGYRLTVDGMVAAPLDLSVADLKARFAPVTVTAVMQCAGNRRADMLAVARGFRRSVGARCHRQRGMDRRAARRRAARCRHRCG